MSAGVTHFRPQARGGGPLVCDDSALLEKSARYGSRFPFDDLEEDLGRARRFAASLLPVLQRIEAHSEDRRELILTEPQPLAGDDRLHTTLSAASVTPADLLAVPLTASIAG